MVDEEVQTALARSFLGKLPPEVVQDLTAERARVDYPAGTLVYRESSAPRAASVIAGLVRIYMNSPEGRQVIGISWQRVRRAEGWGSRPPLAGSGS